MKAVKIEVEFAFNNKCEFVTFKDITVWEAMKKIKKQYGEVIIYELKTEY